MTIHATKKFKNDLTIVRTGRGLTRKAVARLLGNKRSDSIALLEKGARLPSLIKALQLEIIYRRPVAFLFPELYIALREEIRATEMAVQQTTQQTLF